MSRPPAVSALAVVQFLAAAAVCIVLLGERSLDSELSIVDYSLAVGAAVVGAAVVSSSWNGGRVGYWFQVLLALGAVGYGAWRVAEGELPVVVALGVLWLLTLLVPLHRRWLTSPA